jgi:hypothetical protein
MAKKLGIIIPYRDRHRQLFIFKANLKRYMEEHNFPYELIVVEQDDAKVFNRGKLLNIGFLRAKKLKCDYVVFHDIDMIPEDVDYSYSDVPLHMATSFISEEDPNFTRTTFDEYFGGVTMFPMEVFEQINGYSNEYWGWGFEDTDLLYRCKINNIDLDTKEVKMVGGNTAALKFNGDNSYVKMKNIIDFRKEFSIFVSFYPDELTLNHENYDDIHVAFGIPGLDFLISYNSYERYNFELYDANERVIYVNSNIKTNYKTNVCITVDPKKRKVQMFQDGILVGAKDYDDRLYHYKKEEYMYLGVADPNRSDMPKFFKGTINSFALYGGILGNDEIKEISDNQFFGLTQWFGNYKSPHLLQTYYDVKFMKEYRLLDMSGNNNDGEIINCEMVGYTFDQYKTIEIPHRRPSTFRLMSHDENGYVGYGWKDVTTRYNQLRFYNEVLKGGWDTKKEGLNSCHYKETGYSRVNNETFITVEI